MRFVVVGVGASVLVELLVDVYKRQAYECGLYHDLGKCAVLMYIDNNARRLLDEEFFCIQSHPRTGAAILNRMGCGRTLAPAALYHHCYYNGKGGYPNDVPSLSLIHISRDCSSINSAAMWRSCAPALLCWKKKRSCRCWGSYPT